MLDLVDRQLLQMSSHQFPLETELEVLYFVGIAQHFQAERDEGGGEVMAEREMREEKSWL